MMTIDCATTALTWVPLSLDSCYTSSSSAGIDKALKIRSIVGLSDSCVAPPCDLAANLSRAAMRRQRCRATAIVHAQALSWSVMELLKKDVFSVSELLRLQLTEDKLPVLRSLCRNVSNKRV